MSGLSCFAWCIALVKITDLLIDVTWGLRVSKYTFCGLDYESDNIFLLLLRLFYQWYVNHELGDIHHDN